MSSIKSLSKCCFCNLPINQDQIEVGAPYGKAHFYCWSNYQSRGKKAVERYKPSDKHAKYFARPGHVFVRAPDWHWYQKPIIRIQPEDDVILCVFPDCGKNAVQLDSFWPYYAEMTRCAEHQNTQIPQDVLNQLEERNQG